MVIFSLIVVNRKEYYINSRVYINLIEDKNGGQMRIKKFGAIYIILLLLISSLLAVSVSSKDNTPPIWNKDWSYGEEIKLPISTDNSSAKFQPIDIRMDFQKSCWAKNESEHSVRVCCWDGSTWHELESQIYDLEFSDAEHIKGCGLVFLIPKEANGKERYFIYYDGSEKPSPKYPDHLSLEDAYYYLEPISGVSVEGYYYKITEDGYCVYAVGQKGKVMYRQLSQCVIKERPGTKEFSLMDSDDIASFSFSYQHGPNEEDEISSDQSLVSKEIFVDGNLMVEFGIVSESSGKDMRTTNIYKYYYCPMPDKKRICVHVKHEVFKGGTVEGIENLDGRYGALISYKSTSERIKMMRFGEMLPYLHIYDESDNIREYKISTTPESKDREWVISYKDDCDLGKDAWFSYDKGEIGKAHGILFPSNKNIVKYGTDEQDGIQLKAAEKLYLDALGAKVGYVSINFGRNSYKKGGVHDVNIPDDLVVEFDTEFFTTEKGGYKDVIDEGNIYRTLIEHRYKSEYNTFENENIYTLTVIPRFSFGRIFLSHPRLEEVIGHSCPTTWVELYKDDSLISEGSITKPFLGAPKIKFPKLAPGEYTVKVYRKIGDKLKRYIGVESVKIKGDATLYVYCTWEKNIKLTIQDQYGTGIKNVELILYRNNTIVASNVTKDDGKLVLNAPFNYFVYYNLKAYYRGFIIYDKEVPMNQKKVEIDLPLYDLTVDIKDELNFSPGVDVRPFLISSEMTDPLEITPEDTGSGRYAFKNLPAASYKLEISYGSFSDEKIIDVPKIGETTTIKFTAKFDLSTELFDSRGDPISNKNLKIDIMREGQTIYDSMEPNKLVSLPPGNYAVNVYSDGNLVGSKNIELTSDGDIKIVTLLEPILPVLIIGVVLVFIGEIFAFLLFKKISLNTFLKLMAMALILLSLVQPWWVLNASGNNSSVEKNTNMFIAPQAMIDKTTYNDKSYLELATIPEMFTNFLGVLLLIVCSGFVLLGLSFIPNIFLKRRFSLLLISASILFFILVSGAFSLGMSKICEISLGSLQGEGAMNVVLPDGGNAAMSASWGLGIGFYLCIISALIATAAGLLDSFREGSLLRKLFTKK